MRQIIKYACFLQVYNQASKKEYYKFHNLRFTPICIKFIYLFL